MNTAQASDLLTFRTLFRSSEAILEEPPSREEDERYTDYFMRYNSLFLYMLSLNHNFL